MPSILLVGTYPPPYGGVPAHVQDLATYLTEHDWDVHVLSLSGGVSSDRIVDGYHVHVQGSSKRVRDLLHPPPRAARAMLSRPGTRAPRLRLRQLRTAASIARLVDRYDIQMISAYHVLTAAVPAAWVAQDRRLPLVTTIFGEIYDRPELHRVHCDDVRSALQHSNLVLSPSSHCACSIKQLAIDLEVKPLHHGINFDRFYPRPQEPARRELSLNPSGPVVGFVGRMVEEMGVGVLLDAIEPVRRQQPNVHFVIAGATGPLTPVARDLGTQHPGSLTVLADLDPEQIPLVYAASDVMVAPSINTRACLGLALIEAMATERAVIGCRVGGTSEVVTDDETGLLVEPLNPTQLADAIHTLLLDDEQRHRLAVAGRASVEVRFDNRRLLEETNQMFRALLEQKRLDLLLPL